jgi:hypothetical protein
MRARFAPVQMERMEREVEKVGTTHQKTIYETENKP